MDSVSIDFTGTQEEAAVAATAGWSEGIHLAEAESCEFKTSSTGNPMIVVQFRFLGGAVDGKRLTKRFAITRGKSVALSIFFRQMAALGVPREKFNGVITADEVAPFIIGRRVNAKIKYGEYQGEKRPEIDMVLPIAGAAPAGAPAAAAPPPPPGSSFVPVAAAPAPVAPAPVAAPAPAPVAPVAVAPPPPPPPAAAVPAAPVQVAPAVAPAPVYQPPTVPVPPAPVEAAPVADPGYAVVDPSAPPEWPDGV